MPRKKSTKNREYAAPKTPSQIREIANELAQLSMRVSRVADELERADKTIKPLLGNYRIALEAIRFIVVKEFEAKKTRAVGE